jgi:hypothetical protein
MSTSFSMTYRQGKEFSILMLFTNRQENAYALLLTILQTKIAYIIHCLGPKRLFLQILYMLPLALQFLFYNLNGVPCSFMTVNLKFYVW